MLCFLLDRKCFCSISTLCNVTMKNKSVVLFLCEQVMWCMWVPAVVETINSSHYGFILLKPTQWRKAEGSNPQKFPIRLESYSSCSGWFVFESYVCGLVRWSSSSTGSQFIYICFSRGFSYKDAIDIEPLELELSVE